MDERHLLAAARYIERSPVRARLSVTPEEWPWSSAKAHLAGADDERVSVGPLLDLVADWPRFIGEPDATDSGDLLHTHASTGRPLGPDSFVDDLEHRLKRVLKPGKPGPKPVRRNSHTQDRFLLTEDN